MKMEPSDIPALRPLIALVVAEVLAEMQTDESRLNGRLAIAEPEAAALLGVQRHVLRDCRLRREIKASRVGKKVVYEVEELGKFLRMMRIDQEP